MIAAITLYYFQVIKSLLLRKKSVGALKTVRVTENGVFSCYFSFMHVNEKTFMYVVTFDFNIVSVDAAQ